MKSQKQTKEDWKYVEIAYLTKRQRKTIWRGDSRSKLTINHSSLVDQEEEKWWQLWFWEWVKRENINCRKKC